MKERPILFSGAMVRAILAGRKTQTRRVVKSQPYIVQRGGFEAWRWDHGPKGAYSTWKTSLHPLTFVRMACERRPCPYGAVGDRLWVRETFCQKLNRDGYFAYNAKGNLDPTCCWYRADGMQIVASDGDGGLRYRKDGSEASPWTPSIHMPRWASRLTLEITGVRCERLCEITEEDAKAEGVEPYSRGYTDQATCQWAFQELWNSINAKRGFGWDANPWVWVVEFKRVERET